MVEIKMSQDKPKVSTQQSQLHIYQLADYDGSGILLEHCRNILFPHIRANNQARLLERRAKKKKYSDLNATSGYHTQEGSQSPSEGKLAVGKLGCEFGRSSSSSSWSSEAKRIDNAEAGLLWWQLVQENSQSDDQKLEAFRAHSIRLCQIMCELVR